MASEEHEASIQKVVAEHGFKVSGFMKKFRAMLRWLDEETYDDLRGCLVGYVPDAYQFLQRDGFNYLLIYEATWTCSVQSKLRQLSSLFWAWDAIETPDFVVIEHNIKDDVYLLRSAIRFWDTRNGARVGEVDLACQDLGEAVAMARKMAGPPAGWSAAA